MVRPNMKRRQESAIALYFPMVREYTDLSMEREREIKDAIKNAGGSINQSGLFLSATSTLAVVNTATGINLRSVAYIPRRSVTSDVLEMLDLGMHLLWIIYMFINLHNYVHI